ncbi:HD-GYP domain-containing protein [Rubripirellula amarantea]|uniref:HD-GYP domain-containing protein n=1 Tax=Rubripirellula amarantea TaxID=2527999 RepID=UPI0013EF37C9|nr:HD-GYP domain-containing protein [Rubripirellula amarantea]
MESITDDHEMLQSELQTRLGVRVAIADPAAIGCPDVVVAAIDSEDGSAITSFDSTRANVALAISDRQVAYWSTNRSLAYSSIRHARTIVDLHSLRFQYQSVQSQCDQLADEADALAAQVVNDFEELSLIRTLASAMELPSNGTDINELCARTLVPLCNGLGAVSIAAVFLGEDGETLRPVWWSGERLTSDESLAKVVAQHREEAALQPVVRNKHNEFNHEFHVDELNEYVVVQCRSEGRLHGWLVACNRVAECVETVAWAQLGFTTVQASLLETATNQLAAQLHNGRLLRQKEELFTDVVRALVNAVEARDPYTCGHSERVAQFARCLARSIGETTAGCERIYLTGLLHDVGKIAIPDGVLQKPGKLDDDERAIIETHTDAGWRILHELEALRDVLPGVLYHHEKYNGKGYPDGLVGENIPLDGRILAVCDAFDAMTSDRPYRDGMSTEKAVAILREGAGDYWDPNLIDAFCDHIADIDEIRISHRPRRQAKRPSPIDGKPAAYESGVATFS